MKNIEQLKIYYAEFEKSIDLNYRSKKTLQTYKFVLDLLTDWNTTDELLDQINFILKNNKWSQNTLFVNRAIFKAFCAWFSRRNQVYIPFNEKVVKFRIKRGTRQALTIADILMIFKELKNFGNYKFEVIFKLLLLNGIRISEWEKINWQELKNNNFEILLQTAKNNNPRPFRIPADNELFWFENLRKAVMEDISIQKLKSKTIKNYFYDFKRYLTKEHPEFETMLSAHILRHTFVTETSEVLPIETIAKLLGHTNAGTTANTYLNYNKKSLNMNLTKAQYSMARKIWEIFTMPNTPNQILQSKEVGLILKSFK